MVEGKGWENLREVIVATIYMIISMIKSWEYHGAPIFHGLL
jgi:hypothetical protein